MYMKKIVIICVYFLSLVSCVCSILCKLGIIVKICLYIGSTFFYSFVLFLFHEFAHVLGCIFTKSKILKVNIFPFKLKNKKVRIANDLRYSVIFKQSDKKKAKIVYLFGLVEFCIMEWLLLYTTIITNIFPHLLLSIINSCYVFGMFLNKSDVKKIIKLGHK